jgi:hypothetical protein
MSANFKMLVRVFINKSRAPYCKPFYPGWQGYWANNSSAGSLRRLDNALGRLIQNAVIVGFKANAYFLLGHHFPVLQPIPGSW